VKYFETGSPARTPSDPVWKFTSEPLHPTIAVVGKLNQHLNTLQQASECSCTACPIPRQSLRCHPPANLLQLVALDPAVSDSACNPMPNPRSIPRRLQSYSIKQAQSLNTFRIDRLHPMPKVACHVHECRQDYEQALKLTQQAQLTAADQQSLYLWEWVRGEFSRRRGRLRGDQYLRPICSDFAYPGIFCHCQSRFTV